MGFLLQRNLAEFCLKSDVFIHESPAPSLAGADPEGPDIVRSAGLARPALCSPRVGPGDRESWAPPHLTRRRQKAALPVVVRVGSARSPSVDVQHSPDRKIWCVSRPMSSFHLTQVTPRNFCAG